jgi:hypothetical protein
MYFSNRVEPAVKIYTYFHISEVRFTELQWRFLRWSWTLSMNSSAARQYTFCVFTSSDRKTYWNIPASECIFNFLASVFNINYFFSKIIVGISIAVLARPVTWFLRHMFRKSVSVPGVTKELSAVGRKDESDWKMSILHVLYFKQEMWSVFSM